MNRLLGLSNYLLIVVVVLVGLVIEGGIFNFRYFTQWLGDYERIEVVSASAPVVLQQDQRQINYDCKDTYIRNVKIELQSFPQVNEIISGQIYAKTDANRYSLQQVGNFVLNPRREFSSVDNVTLSVGNQILEVAIAFNNRHNPIKITGLTLNAPYDFHFNALRCVVLVLVGLVVLFTLKYRLYQVNFDPEKRNHRLLNYGTMLFNVVLVLGIFILNNPVTGDNAKIGCIFPQVCTEYLGSNEHSLLQDMPRTAQEIIDSPLYVQQLDAWLKGQLHLDIVPDSRISAMANPYDTSDFYRQQVGIIFDRTYYNDKFYTYYGIAPLLMTYLPIYVVTGKVPTPIVVTTILALLSVIAIHALVTAWYRNFGIKGNLLLLLLGQVTVPAVGMVYFLQTALTHYHFPMLTVIIWTCVYALALMKCWECKKQYQRNLLLALAGLSVVMVVLSRPHLLVMALTFSLPLWLVVLKAIKSRNLFFNLGNVLCLGVPVILGAMFVMWHNYARFDSPLQFGQQIVLSAFNNVDYQGSFNLTILSDLFYHLFLAPFDFQETFPFIAVPDSSVDDRTTYIFSFSTIGYFAFPVLLALFLIVLKLERQGIEYGSPLLKQYAGAFSFDVLRCTYGALIAVATLSVFFTYLWGQITTERYMADSAWVLTFVALFLILEHIRYDSASKAALVLYVMVVAILVKSLCLGIMLSFIGPNAFNVDWSMYLYLYDTFRPFAY